jgi:hypothetical protein
MDFDRKNVALLIPRTGFVFGSAISSETMRPLRWRVSVAVSVFHLVSPVTNGTISLPTCYGLAHVPFVIQRPSTALRSGRDDNSFAGDGLRPVSGGVGFQVVKTAQSRGRTERTLLKALSQLPWPDKGREVWFSLGENDEKACRSPDFLHRSTGREQRCATFFAESRMQFGSSNNIYRKSEFSLHLLRKCLRGDFCSPQAPSRGAGMLRTGVIRHCHIIVCDHRVIMRTSADAFPVVGGRCTGRARRCKAKQGRRGKTALTCGYLLPQ